MEDAMLMNGKSIARAIENSSKQSELKNAMQNEITIRDQIIDKLR